MKTFKHKKAFTFIELLIVIAIIGVLATIIIISYMNAQAKARDNKRRADVQEVASAHQLMHHDINKWYINQGYIGISGYDYPFGTGNNGSGTGFFNADDITNYKYSIAHGLENEHYIDTAPRDPSMLDDNDNTWGSHTAVAANAYRHYMVARKTISGVVEVGVAAKLEFPTELEKQDATAWMATSGYSGYSRNYLVVVK